MKSIAYMKQSFHQIEQKKPEATGHDLLIRVKAVSVNPVDYKLMRLHKDAQQALFLGFDAAGIVEAVGEKVTQFKPGDEVWYAGDVTRPGSFTEYQLVDERITGFKPQSLTFYQAAALPLTALTAWELAFDRLNLDKNSQQSLLITGAAGGVGSILIQLLKQLTQTKVIASYGRLESKLWLEQFNCDHTINHNEDINAQIKQLGFNFVDGIFSLNHSDDYADVFADCIKPQGKIAIIDEPKSLNFLSFKTKSVSIHWEFMFTRSMFNTDDVSQQHYILNQVANLVDSQRLKTTVNKHLGNLSIEKLEQVLERLQSGQSRGKFVFSINQEESI